MTMSEVSSLAEVKAHLSELVARVGEQHDRITVTVARTPRRGPSCRRRSGIT